MTEALTCTKIIRIDEGTDHQGNPVFYHKPCGLPASEVEISGLLTSAKAILCAKHKKMADRQSFISVNGYPKGKIRKKDKVNGYKQQRLPGTGLINQ